jgi:transcriptional regulator with XRE-family HTH domain
LDFDPALHNFGLQRKEGEHVTEKPVGHHARANVIRSKRVSLKELAAHVGLSQATVSRLINDFAIKHSIAAETQESVLNAAAALNYKPNVVAHGLRKKQSFTVGLIVPELSEGNAAGVLGGIEAILGAVLV